MRHGPRTEAFPHTLEEDGRPGVTMAASGLDEVTAFRRKHAALAISNAWRANHTQSQTSHNNAAAVLLSAAALKANVDRKALERRKPLLAHVDLDESEGADPIEQQLKQALAENGVKIISLFRQFDKDGSGEVSADEFEEGLRQLGLDVPSDTIRSLYSGWDTDGSGQLTLKELAYILNVSAVVKPLSHINLDESPGAPPISEQLKVALASNSVRIISLFKSWDGDCNGLISLDEFETGLRALGLDVSSKSIDVLYRSWDLDNNGDLSLKELATVLNSATVVKPLSNVDLDESPGAPPISEQLQQALSINAVHILTLFNTWDENGDGKMDKAEFETGLRTLGLDVPTSVIDSLFGQWDTDNSGALSMKELATVLNSGTVIKPLSNVDLDERPGAPPVAEQLKSAISMNAVKIISLFTSWDEDGNGLIDVVEFETGLRALGLDVPSKVIVELFSEWDGDGSGELSLKELARTLNSNAIIKPLSHVDLDESPGAPPISEQLKMALASNSVTVIKLFTSWDENRDGLLVRTEFETGLRALGLDVPTASIHQLFSEWDKDSSGELTIRELTAVLNSTNAIGELRRQLIKNGKKVSEVFRRWDQDGDGEVSRSEFRASMHFIGLSNVDDIQIDCMFDSLDRDGSGSITFKELNKALRRNPAEEAAKAAQRRAIRELEKLNAAKEKLVDIHNLREEVRKEAKVVERRMDDSDKAFRGLIAKEAEEHDDPTQRWRWAKKEHRRSMDQKKRELERTSLRLKLRLRGTEFEPEFNQGLLELHRAKSPSQSRAVTRHGRLPPVPKVHRRHVAPDPIDILSLYRRARHAPVRRHCQVVLPPVSAPKRSKSEMLKLATGAEHMKLCYSTKGRSSSAQEQHLLFQHSRGTIVANPARGVPSQSVTALHPATPLLPAHEPHPATTTVDPLGFERRAKDSQGEAPGPPDLRGSTSLPIMRTAIHPAKGSAAAHNGLEWRVSIMVT